MAPPPLAPFVKLNTDGTSIGNPGAAGIGGVLPTIPKCNADRHLVSPIVNECMALLLRFQQVEMKPIFREANFAADSLAKRAMHSKFSFLSTDSPSFVKPLLLNHVRGTKLPRMTSSP
ncbi:hypothetical protein ACH5RR_002810 [Cinchona calisaya]|uniref:RNase H type-1 domain-containing protein n=1 Tax=Cinchona calisaya TaxID=153742 RepID=A0ABD3ATL8_9GENT